MDICQHHTTQKMRQRCTIKLPSSVVDFSVQQSDEAHIIHSHIIKHMDKLGLLTDSQHGFRKRRSTETQLILSFDDLAKSIEVGEQVDCILKDFSKAFDKVPHNRLLMKLQRYGIRDHLHDCITSFLLGRTQCVVLHGQSSAATTLSSGVPQGTVLFLLLLLTTCHLSSHLPPDCLQMTVFCIEGLEPKRIRPFYRETWTTCNCGKTTG